MTSRILSSRFHARSIKLFNSSHRRSLGFLPTHFSRNFTTSRPLQATKCFLWGSGSPSLAPSPFGREHLSPVELHSPDPNSPISQISFGENHLAILTEAGDVYTLGTCKYGELGHGKSEEKLDSPKKIANLPKIKQVECGKNHSLFLSNDGQVFSCGYGGSFFTAGALGHGSTTSLSVPTLISSLQSVTQISSGANHNLCLTKKGEVYAFGAGEHGRLGTGGSGNEKSPVFLEFFYNKTAQSVSCGEEFSAVCTVDGSVYSFGRNNAGQLGVGMGLVLDQYSMEALPTKVEFDYEEGSSADDPLAALSTENNENKVKVKEISCGQRHMSAISTDSQLFLWGLTVWHKPLHIKGDNSIILRHKMTQVSCGKNYTAATDSTGKLFTWGDSRGGCLGHGSNISVKFPVPVKGFGSGAGENYGAVKKLFTGSKNMAVLTEK
jgi:alpha-tubulin suppressor-like RCC1 family protein